MIPIILIIPLSLVERVPPTTQFTQNILTTELWNFFVYSTRNTALGNVANRFWNYNTAIV